MWFDDSRRAHGATLMVMDYAESFPRAKNERVETLVKEKTN
jgi:hypothetical protein